MIAEPATLYKLMILYILNASEFPLTNSQVCEFLLGKGYTTYFTTQAAISDLIEAQFISVEQKNNSSYYQLTTSGRETLEAFSSSISDGIKNQEFEVELLLKDGKESLLKLQLTVPTELQAELICDHWHKQSSEIYNYLMTTLLAKKDR